MPIMIFMTSYYPELKKFSRKSAAKFLKSNRLLLFLLPVLLLISSCTENSTQIGVDLLPAGDFTKLKSDTVNFSTYNMYPDSVISSRLTLSFLGGLHDPYYGNTFSDFVAQLRLTQAWPGGVPTVDSVRLYFGVSGVKGDLTYKPVIALYEVTEMLYPDSIYYSKRTPKTGMFIGSFALGAVTKDTIQDFSAVLPTSFGEYLLRDTLRLNQLGTDTDFRNFFKGIYVTVGALVKSNSKGGYPSIPQLLVFNPLSDQFFIRVFYHTQAKAGLNYDFVINNNSARYNRYFHDPSTADPDKKINHVNDNVTDTIACAQSLYGDYTLIKLTGLDGLKTLMPISINKARITFTTFLDGVTYKSTTVPSRIYLKYNSGDTAKFNVPDYTISVSFFDGSFNSTTSTYSFNIAAFVQQYLDGKIDKPEVEIYLPIGEYNNAILKSVGSKYPPKFTIVYTRF